MPYKIVKVNGGYKVKNIKTGVFYSKHPMTLSSAKKQLRILEMNK